MKIIYVYTGDYRSYSTTSSAWDGQTIAVEVPDDFSGGAKYYNPDNGVWVDDPPYIPTEEDIAYQFELERTELLNESNRITADWRTELLLDEISDEDKLKLSAWLAYNKAVKATKLGEDWPEKPSQ